jgi:serine/threonine protein kinase/Tol biopolymer transport system component
VLGPLGAGGMGEVYRARDTKLNRDVALKVLPSDVAADPERLARFEREAQTLAALNHPNIAHIHGLEESGGVYALVMELVEGEDLSAHIARGPMPLAEALPIARQIAEALETAHEQGIIHRDLKPANIKIRADGTVKVLDFGLAKAVAPARGPSGDAAGSPTLTGRATQMGMILGTAAYMAPEQARGKVLDKRADIWAFGVVLYEILTGTRAFKGEEVSDVLAAVLRQDIDWIVLPAGTPPRLRRVLERCVDRDPKQRLRDIGEARIEIAKVESGAPDPLAPAVPSAPAAAPLGMRRVTIVAALVLFTVAAFLSGRYVGGRGQNGRAGSQVISFTQVTDQPGVETTPSLSPDGKSIVYAKTSGSETALFLSRVGARNAVRLSAVPPAQDTQPTFSPDGERIAFRSERDGGGIFLMTASGESVTRLTDFGYSPSWSPDGTEIIVSPGNFVVPTDLFTLAKGMSVVNVKSRQRRELGTTVRALQPAWSPGGRRIAYWGVRGDSGQRDIWTLAADGSDEATGGVAVTDDPAVDWSPTWSPDGRYLYFSSTRGGTTNLWRVAIDEVSGRVRGEPEAITAPSTWSGYLSFSRDGSRLAFASLDYRSTLFRAPFDAARESVGPPAPILKGTRPIRDHELSPDGAWVAFTEAGGREDLFVARIDGTEYRRLTDDPSRDRGPSWSPDGTRIAFYSDRSGTYDVWTIRPDGSELAELTRGSAVSGFPVWSPDGARVAFGFDKWLLVDAAARGTPAPPPEPAISAAEWFMPTSWSPTGGRLVGPVRAGGGSVGRLSVYTLATKQYATVPGDFARAASWVFPSWLADGRRLLVRRPEGIAIIDGTTGAGRLLLPVGGHISGKSLGVSRDNKWITYTETATEGDIWIATMKK